MLKLRAGNKLVPCTITSDESRLYFQFSFNKELMAEIKAMKGAKWHGYDEKNPRKIWSVQICKRNLFQLNYLAGRDPYKNYDLPLGVITPNRPEVMSHQKEFIAHGLQRKRVIIAGEMGTGKTLAMIEIMEQSGLKDWIYVGPKSALAAAEVDFIKWRAKVNPQFMTYNYLTTHYGGTPQGVCFDESTKLKTPTSKRSEAAASLVERMGPDAFVILASGAPAPKSPVDWYNQCELACPGFLREGDILKFKKRLALILEKESVSGGVYPELVTWWDDERKCATCGKFQEEHNKFTEHPWKPSVNEVAHLYNRMKGLVLPKLKKDCLELPEKIYRIVTCPISKEIERTANLISRSTARAIEAMTLLRELSDGFQYKDVESGLKNCPVCNGIGQIKQPVYNITECTECGEELQLMPGKVTCICTAQYDIDCTWELMDCKTCSGKGVVPNLIRGYDEVKCPKDDALIDLLDEHEDYGRFIVYAGFQASVDRCVKIAVNQQWEVIRVDGRGWSYFGKEQCNDLSPTALLQLFQGEDSRKIVFIGQAGAAGMGLTLTASPSILFFSNSFNGEDRIQAEDRIHRPGCKGANIIDLVHLPIDNYILENLKKKRDLLKLTMQEFNADYYGNTPVGNSR